MCVCVCVCVCVYMIGFPGGLVEKNLPATARDTSWSLDQEDPLQKEMATHSSIPVWRIPWTEKPGVLQSMGLQSVGPNLATKQHIYLHISI